MVRRKAFLFVLVSRFIVEMAMPTKKGWQRFLPVTEVRGIRAENFDDRTT